MSHPFLPSNRRRFLRAAAAAGAGGLSMSSVAPAAAVADARAASGAASEAASGTPSGPGLGPASPFSGETLRRRARALSTAPWRAPDTALPPALEALDYDGLRDIRYVRERDLWFGEHAFNIEFFHLGDRLDEAVAMHVVEGGHARELLYSPDLFDFGDNGIDAADLASVRGFAGVRILYPLNSDAYLDELGAFLGASYFRLLGETMRYGLSARGLALDTASDVAEEFPVFRELYFETPTASDVLVVHALLDSPSVAGAYRFEIRPGADTVMDVDVALYPRRDLPGVGIAPLTSMFLFAPNDRHGVDDFRERVHDSDGLLMHSGTGERLWRPVTNPDTIRVSSFANPGVRGFGLMQRTRRFDAFQDLEARYERRPSAWVEPLGDWGPGRVMLVELPTPNETEDNLVAFWRPDAPLAGGAETRLRYRLHWCLEAPGTDPATLRAVTTRTGSGNGIGRDPGEDPEFGTRLFMIDFAGEDLPDADVPVEAVASATGGSVSSATTRYSAPSNTWRVWLRVRAGHAGGEGMTDAPTGTPTEARAGEPVEIRCFLRLGERALSETWLYRWMA